MSETDYCEVNCGEIHQPGCSHYVIQEVEKQRDLIELCGKLQVERDQLREEVKRLKAELEVCHKHLKRATSDLSYCVAVPIDDYESSQALKQKALALAEAHERIVELDEHPQSCRWFCDKKQPCDCGIAIAKAALAVFRGQK